jgi:hypothetical protein
MNMNMNAPTATHPNQPNPLYDVERVKGPVLLGNFTSASVHLDGDDRIMQDREEQRRRSEKHAADFGRSAYGSMDAAMTRWKKVFRTMNRKNGYTGTGKYTIANFLFLLVIAGTEMDMAGLFLSAGIYLKYDPFFDILLRFVLVSFILPLFLVTVMPFVGMCCSKDGESAFDTMMGNMMGQYQRDADQGETYLGKFLKRVNPHGGGMEFYHWVPGLRFYLMVKASYTPTDVDALFRVNSISTFTFGIFQVVGIMATYVRDEPITLYVIINIVSQILNWGLTMLYFGSNISVWMGIAGQVRTMKSHYRGLAIEYSRLLALRLNDKMEGVNCASTEKKIRQMHLALCEMIEWSFFGEVDDVEAQADVGGDLDEVVTQIDRGEDLRHNDIILMRRMLRRDMHRLRPIDVHTFIDILKEQAITCYSA